MHLQDSEKSPIFAPTKNKATIRIGNQETINNGSIVICVCLFRYGNPPPVKVRDFCLLRCKDYLPQSGNCYLLKTGKSIGRGLVF